ncbi:hypothetical protein [Clostridium sp. DJ247]|uniref:hypothetical protein n=1 Tax=Clostridium sp. DJ247 TaxID=2726188 RepID=UPI001629F232|nr:hypothetical protein [Clostridium sp. DJ247]MBC2579355.1 hypothetical protein [Clostridium sp. DJ247]
MAKSYYEAINTDLNRSKIIFKPIIPCFESKDEEYDWRHENANIHLKNEEQYNRESIEFYEKEKARYAGYVLNKYKNKKL